MTMSILTNRSPTTVPPSPWTGLVRWGTAWPLALMSYWHRRATIKTLRELDDHTLRDIGLTRADLDDALQDRSSLDL
ncbi:DUF1127 domain-containing protein [Bradyrhizobium sp. STM 3557]|uniref:DUF1127 domain-containing protein n=1 Tax=Bradyrhizobium sp. STM 3557 TaxID=578920 RepID=UPI00388D99D7